MGLSYDEIAEILKVIDGSSCDELIVETGDMKLVVRRNSGGGHVGGHVAHDAAPSLAPRSSMPPPPAAAAQPAPAGKTVAAATGRQIEVVAPMVGTFYRSPAPDAPPFVDIGSVVRKGDALCLIEVMKLFTTITAEFDGRVVQIGADNGELVEYGRALFVIEPT